MLLFAVKENQSSIKKVCSLQPQKNPRILWPIQNHLCVTSRINVVAVKFQNEEFIVPATQTVVPSLLYSFDEKCIKQFIWLGINA